MEQLSAPQTARALFLPLSLSQNAAKIVTSVLVDRLSSMQRATLFVASNTAVAFVSAASLSLQSERALVAWAVLYGVSTGCYMALAEIIIASLFGTAALGSLMGVARGVDTAATGLGPLVFAISLERAGSYAPGVLSVATAHLSLSAAMLVAAWHALGGRGRRPVLLKD